MVVIMKPGASDDDVSQVVEEIQPHGMNAHVSRGKETTISSDAIETGDGGSAAASAAVTPLAPRVPAVTTAEVLPIVTVPPYSAPESVQRMGTS